MQAVISGQAGVALLVEDQQLRSLHAGTAEIIQRREREIPYLLGNATDLQFLEDVEIPEISRHLEIATAQADALHLALILLDPELPQDVRCDAANELAELFALDDVREYVESVLFAHPLPIEADLPGALSCCSTQSVAVRDLLVSLERLQSEILEVFTAWERIPTPVFGEEKGRASALAIAVREGLFRELVLCRAAQYPIERFLRSSLLKSKVRCEILFAWGAVLRNSLPSSLDESAPNKRAQRLEIEQLNSLTPREREVLSMLAAGLPNKLIAGKLGTSERTIKVHRARVMEKMHAESLAALVGMVYEAVSPRVDYGLKLPKLPLSRRG